MPRRCVDCKMIETKTRTGKVLQTWANKTRRKCFHGHKYEEVTWEQLKAEYDTSKPRVYTFG